MSEFEIAQLLAMAFGFLGVVWHQQRTTSKLRAETREDFREVREEARSTRASIDKLRDDSTASLDKFRDGTAASIDKLRDDSTASIDKLRTETAAGFAKARDDLDKLRAENACDHRDLRGAIGRVGERLDTLGQRTARVEGHLRMYPPSDPPTSATQSEITEPG